MNKKEDSEENWKRIRLLNAIRFKINITLNYLKNLVNFVILSNKISNKVVAIVCRRFKTNDEAVLV